MRKEDDSQGSVINYLSRIRCGQLGPQCVQAGILVRRNWFNLCQGRPEAGPIEGAPQQSGFDLDQLSLPGSMA